MYTIYPLKVAEETDPGPLVFYLDNWDDKIRLFSYMWLIRGGGETILVDTGFTREVADEFGPGVIQRPDEVPSRQLERHGVRPDEIGTVIITHAHFDHLSPTIEQFANARIVIQAKEVSYAKDPPHPVFGQFILDRVIRSLPAERLAAVDGDAEVLPGIRVLRTGGHTPGHQSVTVRTGRGTAIITGDVVFTYRNLEEDIPVGLNTNLEECCLAMRRIREEADIILPGHDPLVMERYGSGIE